MGYVCNECGNRDKFRQTIEITQYGTEDTLITSNGDIIDYMDTEIDDSDCGDIIQTVCDECLSENVVFEHEPPTKSINLKSLLEGD